MTPQIASLLLPAMRHVDPERAHGLALRALRWGLAGRDATPDNPVLATTLFGRAVSNPIGLAAGFDKDAVAVGPLMRLGFGAVETGTVTPLPQAGNARPRLFRLEDGAVINRMGLNNQGVAAYVARLAAVRRGPALLGANVGINKTGADPERDYPALVAAVGPHVDYVVINVSSPNTPGLRNLQGERQMRAILLAVAEGVPQRPPVFVKIAPDLPLGGLESLVEAAVDHGVTGLIVANTTVERPDSLRGRFRGEGGGLSGPPLMAPSTALLARAWRLAGGRLVLIGCGGVSSGLDVLAKLQAGAQLVQLYAAFAVHGPALIPRMKRELAAALRERGFGSAAEAVRAAA